MVCRALFMFHGAVMRRCLATEGSMARRRAIMSQPPKPARVQLKDLSNLASQNLPKRTPKPRLWKTSKSAMGKGVWRLLLVSEFGALAFVIYEVRESRSPTDQPDPDPTKKTLVVLGTGWGSVSLLKTLDTDNYNIIVISPRNYFLFTPLLPSCTTGTIEHRSIMEPVRSLLRRKSTATRFYEAECTKIDHENKVIHISDRSEIKGDIHQNQVPYDLLVVGVGAENATFGVPGVKEHACFLKEVGDAQMIRKRIMDCCETSMFKDQSPDEIKRLLHMVVVGGGPTGIEFAGELQDFFENDLKKWIPEITGNFRVTLIEALPSILPMFSKTLVDYTEKTFRDGSIDIRTKTTVKRVYDQYIEAECTGPYGEKSLEQVPYGLLVWATGNTPRPLIHDLVDQIPQQRSRRGLAVDDYLAVEGAKDIWAVGDCAVTPYAPTAQVAVQQGRFLAKLLNNMASTEEFKDESIFMSAKKNGASGHIAHYRSCVAPQYLQTYLILTGHLEPFKYSHQGSLAYIGSEKAVADLTWMNGNLAVSGQLTYIFWRSIYLSMCFSMRNRLLVSMDWIKACVFGRDVARE